MLIGNFFPFKKESYVVEVQAQEAKEPRFGKVRCYSFFGRFGLFILAPCRWLGQFFGNSLFNPSRRHLHITPNQTASLVASQIVANMRGVASIAEQNGADYLFALQPSLMYTGPVTKDDKIFYESKNKTPVGGFRWSEYVKTYYELLAQNVSADEKLKNDFLNLGALFAETEEQIFVDTLHMGNRGQEECAKVLAEKIWERLKEKKDA